MSHTDWCFQSDVMPVSPLQAPAPADADADGVAATEIKVDNKLLKKLTKKKLPRSNGFVMEEVSR